MAGIGDKAAWSWIFILEGLATVIAGAVSFWIIVDFPDDATFLSEAERTVVIRRLQGDDQFSAAGERLRWKNIVASVMDWKTYLYGACPCGSGDEVLTRWGGSDCVLWQRYALVCVFIVFAEYHLSGMFFVFICV